MHLFWGCEFFWGSCSVINVMTRRIKSKKSLIGRRSCRLMVEKKCKLATLPCCPPLLSYHTLWLTLYVKKLSYFLPTVGAFDRPSTNFRKKSGARVWPKAKKHGSKLWNRVCQPLEDGERPTAKAIGKLRAFNLWSWIKFHFEKFVKL